LLFFFTNLPPVSIWFNYMCRERRTLGMGVSCSP
jgi:hypothetical protein